MTDAKVLAIVPIRGRDEGRSGAAARLGDRALMDHTLEAARQARTISRVVVTTDSADIQARAVAAGVEAPFLRPPDLTGDDVSLDRVLQHCVRWLEEHERYVPDVVVLLEITHPVRAPGLVDRVVETLLGSDLDSVFVAHPERHSFWIEGRDGALRRVGDDAEDLPRTLRAPVYREMSGLACATRTEFVRAGARLGRRVGLVALRGIEAIVDTKDEDGLWLAGKLLEATPAGRD